MTDISIPWGGEDRTLSLPAAWRVQREVRPAVAAAPDAWPDHLAAALARPEGMPPLAKLLAARPGGRIAIIVEDVTRHSPLPQILDVLLRELTHAGVGDDCIEIVFATGMHPAVGNAQAAQKLGGEVASRLRWRSNDWSSRGAYVRIDYDRQGPTGMDLWIDRQVADADLRILVTSVSPHVQAGFGGGHKMLLPGCAHLDSIRQLHLAGVPRRSRQMVGQPTEVNRMRRLIDAAGAAVDRRNGRTFGVQYVLDAQDRLAAIAAGDVTACQRMLAKQCAAAYGAVIDAPADVVIANAHPRDFDLWQSFKAIANTCWAVRDNGVLICLARCPAGANMPTFSLPIGPRWVRRLVRLMGAGALGAVLTRSVPRMAGDAAFFVRLALHVLQRATVIMVSPQLVEDGTRLLGMELVAEPQEAFAMAEAVLGEGAKRVLVFPAGGVSYPVFPR